MVKTNEELECPSEECGRKEIFNNDIFSQCDHAVHFFRIVGWGASGAGLGRYGPTSPLA